MRGFNQPKEDDIVHSKKYNTVHDQEEGEDELLDEEDEYNIFPLNPHYNKEFLKYLLTTIFPLGSLLDHSLMINSEQSIYPDTNAASNIFKITKCFVVILIVKF